MRSRTSIEQESPNHLPLISVIIPTRNSAKSLQTCIKAVQDQSYHNVEIIVVDAFSYDDTPEICQRLHVRLIQLAGERSLARNVGSKHAKGSFLFFIDSDMELARDVVAECVSLTEHGNVDAIIVPEESVGTGFLSECRKMEKEMRQGSDLSEAPRFFSRKAFESVGGYRENLVLGEDFDLGKRIENAGYKTERCKARIRHHEQEIPLKRLVLKIYYYGKKLPSYARKNPSLAARTSCPFHIAKNIKMIRRHPAPFVGLLILKLVEYVTYVAGAFSNLLP